MQKYAKRNINERNENPETEIEWKVYGKFNNRKICHIVDLKILTHIQENINTVIRASVYIYIYITMYDCRCVWIYYVWGCGFQYKIWLSKSPIFAWYLL